MSDASGITLQPHRLKLALLQPQIAPNTGNIARLCVATGTALHLVRPLGFVLSDRELKRSAMDYWPRLNLTLHDDTACFLRSITPSHCWFLSTKATRSIWEARFDETDCLVLGSETHGIDEAILAANANQALRIPQARDERCLNLATAAGIALFEALRQLQNQA